MTELEYIEEIRSRLPTEGELSLDVLAFADIAVQKFPDSAKLWCLRGDLIQLGPADGPGLDEALACYERAVAIDPMFAEAYEEMGHFFDAVMPDPKRARLAFHQAASIRRTLSA
jgi:hypothetical protein